jgi:hypothetical protein
MLLGEGMSRLDDITLSLSFKILLDGPLIALEFDCFINPESQSNLMKAGLAFMVIAAVCIIFSLFVTIYLLIPGIIFLIVGAALLYVENVEAKGGSIGELKGTLNRENWQCSECGYLNFDDMVYCGKCGQKKNEQPIKDWFCQECGRPNPSGTVFCGKCGAKKR